MMLYWRFSRLLDPSSSLRFASLRCPPPAYSRVLYLDLDAHHGDGVQQAFFTSSSVFTLSFHHASPGFFPGTGGFEEIGVDAGKYYCLNVPLKAGFTDHTFQLIFDHVFPRVMRSFSPDVIVVECGVDGMAGDPVGVGNLTPVAFLHALHCIRSTSLPLLILGGGVRCCAP